MKDDVAISVGYSGRAHKKLTEVTFSEFGDAQAIEPYMNGIGWHLSPPMSASRWLFWLSIGTCGQRFSSRTKD